MKTLSLPGDEWLLQISRRLVSEDVVAVALSGSYARGGAAPYSDVDLVCLTENSEEAVHERDMLFYRDEYLISISFRTLESRFRELERPRSAIFAVLPWQRARPLFDREGSLERLQRAARAFEWFPLQGGAHRAAAGILVHQVEVVHKTLGSLALGDDERAAIVTWELVQEMTIALALHHGTLIESSNTLFQQVRQSVGETSDWAIQQRRAIGVDEDTTFRRPVVARAIAALRCYEASADRLMPLLDADQGAVVDTVLRHIRGIG